MVHFSIKSRPVVLFLLVGMLSACAARELRKGQDYFNEAATIENRALLTSVGDNPEASPVDAIAALNKYRLAEASLLKQLEEDARELKADKLYGSTYVLLAMAQWRISDLEGNALSEKEKPSLSKKSAEELQPTENNAKRRQTLLATINTISANKKNWTLGTRDRVISHALYGFYDHDGGRMAKDYERAREWFTSALDRFDEAIETNNVPPNHPVRVYIAMAKLRTLASWLLASYSSGLTDQGNMKDVNAINDRVKKTVCSIQSFYEAQTEYSKQLKSRINTLLVPIGLDIPDERVCEEIQ
ncbi:MAG: hypothetical protein MI685_06840 [Chlorobiales bacterium]|nr:hypothetical protein [Chlorobiales bacterium]